MDVYAQPTCVNLTLCSLLTSLLSRSLRSEFTDAIERKADVLSTNRTYINEAGDQLHVGLIFAGPSIIIDNLARLAPKFSRMHVFDVATVPMQTRTGLPSGASVMKALQAVQKSIHFFNQTKRRFIIVSIGYAMEIFSQLFCKTKVTGVIGFLAVNPPCHDLHVMASFLPAFLPTLVVLSLHDSQQSEKERYLFISLPNVVVVHHNNQLDGYEWGRWTENDATLKSGPIPYTYLLWLVRLIAQYSEVIASLDQEDNFLQDICVGRTDENSKLTSRL